MTRDKERKQELLGNMNSFSKDLYHKTELLPEMMQLQKELVDLTFNDVHAEGARLRIWDVYNHFQKLNEERGHIADEKLNLFQEGCKTISNTISGEISGNKGEEKAARSLENIRCPKYIMRNIEFHSNHRRTELDAIVYTAKAVFLIEVKNPSKDVHIDEKGNYCRGEFRVFDKKIGERMNDKVFLLREALKEAEIADPNIVSLLVFTNNNIKVESSYPYIDICYLSSLPHKIERYEGDELYSNPVIQKMMECVNAEKCHESYPLPLDIKQFKEDFADLMVIFETVRTEKPCEENACRECEPHVVVQQKKRCGRTVAWVICAVACVTGTLGWIVPRACRRYFRSCRAI